MARLVRENPIGDFIKDILNVLDNNSFDEIIWVGMHEWLSYVTRVLWLKGYKFETAITPVDSRWDQDVYEDDEGHKIHITSLDYAQSVGDRTIYIIANNYVSELKKQLIGMGISEQRIFSFQNGTVYHLEANERVADTLKNGYKPMTHKEIQGVLLDLLKEFARFCEEYGLTYFLDGGTLLGAVRHQGFIPWDNDADVAMPFEDYQKLIEIYPSDMRYELINWTNNDVTCKCFAELGDLRTRIHIPFYVMAEPVHLDIFPLTGCSGNEEEIASKLAEREKLGQKWRECVFLSELGVKDERAYIFNKLLENPIDKCEKIIMGTYPTFRPMGSRISVYSRECFAKSVKCRFEDTYFPIPVGWNEVLREIYHNYMNLPPAEARVGYPNKFYWNNYQGGLE